MPSLGAARFFSLMSKPIRVSIEFDEHGHGNVYISVNREWSSVRFGVNGWEIDVTHPRLTQTVAAISGMVACLDKASDTFQSILDQVSKTHNISSTVSLSPIPKYEDKPTE